ncbi:hypothetical protein C0J52_02296 [Blattella germanica]|nr:hypothetical protein C0J52_02296 [Blattella germanica]
MVILLTLAILFDSSDVLVQQRQVRLWPEHLVCLGGGEAPGPVQRRAPVELLRVPGQDPRQHPRPQRRGPRERHGQNAPPVLAFLILFTPPPPQDKVYITTQRPSHFYKTLFSNHKFTIAKKNNKTCKHTE